MSDKKYLLEQMTWPEALKAFSGDTTVVVIPTGSTEQHGPHLPLGTDFLIAHDLARRVGERADVIVTPTLPIGYAEYHTAFPGTLSIHEDTLARVYMDVCEHLVRYGATHILVVNGHGGNMTALRQCGEELRKRRVPMAIACWWQMSQVVNPDWLATGHGDYVETSAILAVNASLADLSVARLPKNKNLTDRITLDTPEDARFKGGRVIVNLTTADSTDTGDMMEYGLTAAASYDTPPTAGTAEMGMAILNGLADYLVEFIAEFRKVRLQPLDRMGPLAK
jgi:creatinine amidohydrolase